MKYTVKNKDGELTYGSLDELKTAYVLGLIEAEDDVLEESATLWRKAGAIPLLVTARKITVDRGHSFQQRGWFIAALVLAILDFYFLLKGYWLVGGLSAFVVTTFIMQLLVVSSRRKR